jgi:hypothetical protein
MDVCSSRTDLRDVVGGAIECAARHQKYPSASRWRAPSATTSAARLAEHHHLHLAEVDAARMQHSLSSLGRTLMRGHPRSISGPAQSADRRQL